MPLQSQCVIGLHRDENATKKNDVATISRAHWDVFLLFDFVHIVKSTRNNWITEKKDEFKIQLPR